MKICFFGIYDPSYSRNDILLTGLRALNVEIVECREDWRDRWRYFKLCRSLLKLRNSYDYVFAAYPAPVPTILARMLSRRPVISDMFYSMFDAVVNDRREVPWYHPKALKLLVWDWCALRSAHLVLTDTKEHKKYFESWFGVNKAKIHQLYLGINPRDFYPLPEVVRNFIQVHFHGKYIPLQGVSKIVEAANLLRANKDIRFRLVGSGQDSAKVNEIAEKYKLNNIEFINRVPLGKLNEYMGDADIVLGIFGDTDKAYRVIPNKVYEGLAAGRAMVTMDSPAIREIFSDKELMLVANTPQDLSEAILALAENQIMRKTLSVNGHEAVSKYYPRAVAQHLLELIKGSAL